MAHLITLPIKNLEELQPGLSTTDGNALNYIIDMVENIEINHRAGEAL